MNSDKIRLEDLPKDSFELRGKLFLDGIEDRVASSVKFRNEEYPQMDRLNLCNEFMDFVYSDCFKGDIQTVRRHGGFPAIEATFQFDHSVKHALVGSYKAAFDCLRSCLELTLLSVYFSFDGYEIDWLNPNTDELFAELQKGSDWFNSISDTPFFSKMIKAIKKNKRFSEFDVQYSWFDELKENYHSISDFTHIKGYSRGTQKINGTNFFINKSSLHAINKATLKEYFDLLIRTTENIVVLISLYNPIVLVDLPLEEKFGMDEPIGFIHPGQSELFNQILPKTFETHFVKIKNEDEEVLTLVEWVNSRPSLTQCDIDKQISDFNKLFQKDSDD